MASYDPRVYQMHAQGIHPALMNNVAPHFGNLGTNAVAMRQQPSPVSSGATNRGPAGAAAAKEKRLKVGSGWQQTYRTAQNIAFPDTKDICSEVTGIFLEDLAKGIGCPLEYVLVPLMPCIGGLLGTSTTIRVHRGWCEPPIVWSIVSASPGSRRSAVIRQLLSPILNVQKRWLQENGSSSKDASNSRHNAVHTIMEGTDEDEEQSRDDMVTTGSLSEAPKRFPKDMATQRFGRRTLYSGTRITAAALTEVLHRNDGHAFSLTENVENLHEMLGLLQPMVPSRLVSVMEDLYEGLPLVAVEEGRVTSILGSNFNHGGFATPEYSVTLMLKCPSWFSSRLLISCPQVDDMKGMFGEPNPDINVPELEQVFDVILRQHQVRCTYTYESEATQVLNTFFEDEWASVLNQLDQNEHEGIIGKSMGQIVRISGILKALENGIKVATAEKNSDPLPDWEWTINESIAKNAVVLGKYFLEQKLAMTFMVSTGFFSSANPRDASNSSSPTTLHHSATGDSSNENGNVFSDNDNQSLPSTSSSAPGAGRPVKAGNQDSMYPIDPNLSSFELPKLRGGPEEVDYSTLPQSMTTREENMNEMMQGVDFVHFSRTQFVAIHGRRIKRLLECYDDGHGVSATTAAQKSITPPVRIEGTNNRHPAWASALFFQKVADLQLGTAQQGRHPTNRKVCWRFKRKPVDELTEKDFQLLQYLRVDMEAYSHFGTSSFNPTMMVNAGIINLDQNIESSSPGLVSAQRPPSIEDNSGIQSSTGNMESAITVVKPEIF